jgi:glycosyltransferase involved in cell wall biosynthesis
VGTPVLISNNVGLSNYVAQNGFGWITGIESVTEIREKLTQAYNNRQERNEIASRARQIIDRDFNEAKLAGDYVKLYESTNAI